MILGMSVFSRPHNPLVLGSSPSCPTFSTHTSEQVFEHYAKGLSAARKHTVGELIDRFIEQCVPQHPIYYPKKVQLLLRWKQEFGSMLLRDLSPSSIAI